MLVGGAQVNVQWLISAFLMCIYIMNLALCASCEADIYSPWISHF